MLSATERTIEKVMETAIRSTADARAPKIKMLCATERTIEQSDENCDSINRRRAGSKNKNAVRYRKND